MVVRTSSCYCNSGGLHDRELDGAWLLYGRRKDLLDIVSSLLYGGMKCTGKSETPSELKS